LELEIRTIGDPVLQEKCREVDQLDSEVSNLIDDMIETLGSVPGRAGLAASQVGVLKSLFVYDIGYGPRCLVNPELIETDNEIICEEGCLSIPGVSVSLPRFERVKVRCQTPSGHNIVLESRGFTAQVIQHECDHLEGVMIIDRCDSEEKKRALEEYQELVTKSAKATA
jgi:peptide deformylase